MTTTDKAILQLAVPSIISNITVPLLGLVDLAITGHLGDGGRQAYIAAISVGTMIFNIIYWLMGFLRMGTSGMTGQAYGARDGGGVRLLLRRSITVALVIAGTFLVLQWPLREAALAIIHPSAVVRPLAATYFNIVIWGAPAMLTLYSLNGWFIGMQDTRVPMVVAILQNVVNIVASLTFVFGLGMKIEGVALGTLVAQWSGVLLAAVLARRKENGVNGVYGVNGADGADGADGVNGADGADGVYGADGADGERGDKTLYSWGRFFTVNRDIFLRTLCLVAVNLAFTSVGAREGDLLLAVNTLLMTFYTLFSYVMDGFAFAGEALAGKSYGAGDRVGLKAVIRALLVHWGLPLALLFTLLYVVCGRLLLHVLTDDAAVIAAAATYAPWTWLIPMAGFAAFVYDGIFIGITATRGMLLSSFVASLAFFLIVAVALATGFSNHFLWLAFIAYLALRGGMQWGILKC